MTNNVMNREDIDKILAPGGALEAFERAKKAGKCRFIGFTGHFDPEIHAALLKATDKWETVMMPIHAADHAYLSFEKTTLPVAVERGVGVQAIKVFGKAFLLRSLSPTECLRYIFLRRDFGVYLIDQPRRGNAGRSTQQITITPTPDEQGWFGTFRLGIWPDFFPGVQFSRDPEALNQYFRSMTPSTGSLDGDVMTRAVAALFDKIGTGVLVTHSHSGGFGWRTAIKSQNVRAIVSYEPGSGFVFPEGEAPAPIQSSGGPLAAQGIPLPEFMSLTKIPIVIYYGDFIPKEPMANPGQDGWRARLEMARKWRDAVNKHGGDVTLVHLPEVGIKGNTHFPFSDLNNLQIADLMSTWLNKKGLDKYPKRSGRSKGL